MNYQNPKDYQKELMDKHELDNAFNQQQLYADISEGAYILYEGQVEGPYTISTVYFLSNGKNYTVVTPSNLQWTYSLPIIRID